MFRMGFVLSCLMFFACKNEDKKNDIKQTGEQQQTPLESYFPKAPVPYQLSDADLQKPDTSSIKEEDINGLIPDSIKNLFGERKFRYAPLAKIQTPKSETYLVIKISGNKKGAIVVVVDKDKKTFVTLPFLISDDDATTSQSSIIDQNYSVTRLVTRKKGDDVIAEGRDVFVYDRNTKQFSWLVHDALDESNEVINPIETLPRKNKLSGDYVKNKKNIVSVRDGRDAIHLVVFIHTETEDECKGELKGECLISSPTTATFKHPGDPCVLTLNFRGSSVSLHEEQGCGNHRDLNCKLEGTFVKKKELKKQSLKKHKK